MTPYLYSTYESECESRPTDRQKVMILGGGPNRIGQGIEFDYCCCHAVFALRELGIETIMVNCNPETVSTDYDTSDRLYFEPITVEDVLSICEEEASKGELLGVIVQFGGQTPLKLSVPLERAGVIAAEHLLQSRVLHATDRLIGVGAERFRQWVHAAEQEAGLGRVWPHLLRHAASTRVARSSDPETWRRFMNHADLSQWARYVAGTDERVRAAVPTP